MASVKRVSPAEAKALLDEGWIYLDVRSEPEFAAGHPAGASNVPVAHSGPRGMQPNPDFIGVVEALYPKDTRIVVGCQAGGRSLRAAEMMAAAGFTQVVDQRAGFGGARDAYGQVSEPGWAAAGLPVETDTPGRSYGELKADAAKR
jgi:rhodanese-related sulfurtransferase